ncbi:MAG: ABC transporter ATP-binding protein/permease [Alphaproteobacteria bacterium]|nr:ABC transporter ATP-binding protein/permease [Alphaproteobacteria bacterium]
MFGKKKKRKALSAEEKSGLMKRVYKDYGKPNLKGFVFASLILLSGSLMEAYAISLLKNIFDEGFLKSNMDVLYFISFQITALYVFKSIINYFGGLLIAKISLDAVNSLRKRVWAHLSNLDMSFFDKNNSSIFITRITSDCSAIINIITSSITTVFKQAATAFAMIGLMVWYSWRMTLVTFVFIPIGFLLIKKIVGRTKKIAGSLKKESEKLLGRLTESLQAIKVVKAYGIEKTQAKQVISVLDEQNRLAYKSARVSSRATPIMESLSGFATAAIIVSGGICIAKGYMTTGEFVTFLTAWVAAYKPLKAVGKFSVSMQNGLVSAERVYSVLDEEPRIVEVKKPKKFAGLKSDISFEGVDFSYDGKKQVLNSVDLVIPKGKTVAFVGASGSGKSTILSMVLRLYDPTNGAVKFDGVDLKEYSINSIRKQMAFVSQDNFLFDDSVKNNIAIGAGDHDFDKVSLKKVKDAAKSANADEFIGGFVDGYDSEVGEAGGRLSGGQKQRLSIARAMVRNASILLLDEATSALDTKSERAIQDAIEKMSEGKTVLVVAHRLSTVMHADIIYVVNEGQIVESGDHDKLLKKGGFYKALYETQFKKKS